MTTPTPTAPAPKKKSNTGGVGCLLILGLIVWAIATRASGSTGSAGIITPAAATARPAPAVLLQVMGNGIKKSQPFTAAGPWTLAYDFDCTSFGFSGNFVVTVYGTDGVIRDLAVNELAMRGHDTTQSYETGSVYLDMNSECRWAVQVNG